MNVPDSADDYRVRRVHCSIAETERVGGWDAQQLRPDGTLITYQGSSNHAYFGQELGNLGFVGGYTSGISYFSTRALLFAPAHYSPQRYRTEEPT